MQANSVFGQVVAKLSGSVEDVGVEMGDVSASVIEQVLEIARICASAKAEHTESSETNSSN